VVRVVVGVVTSCVDGVGGMVGDEDDPADGFDGVVTGLDAVAPEKLDAPSEADPLDGAPGTATDPVAVAFCD